MSSSTSAWFPKRWSPEHPERIQLYSLATPNGQKVSIALEEMGLPYEAHLIDILNDDQQDPDYLKLSPNGKIPTLSDPDFNGSQILLMESGAILEYLAEKTGQFFGDNPQERWAIKQWLYFQMGHIGPMFGQFGHFFKYAKDKCDHPYPVERYRAEANRLLKVLDNQLDQHTYVAGDDYSIADMAIWPWVDALQRFYKGDKEVGLNELERVKRWLDSVAQRPAVQAGRNVCPVD